MPGQPNHIFEAAYDGELEAVKEFLKGHPERLDARYKSSDYVILDQTAAWAGFLLKKGAGAFLGLFSYAAAVTATIETWGASAFLIGASAGGAERAWTVGDAAFKYHMQDINHWTPLDCAALGHANGNENAINVATYLIGQGAQPSMAKSSTKFFFEIIGTPVFVAVCQEAIRVRTERLGTENNRRRAENAQREMQAARQVEQQRAEAFQAEQARLAAALQVQQAQAEALQAQLEATRQRLAGVRPVAQVPGGILFFMPEGPAASNDAAPAPG